VMRGVEVVTLRPPLEDFPAEHEVALPLRIDWLPTHEDNCRVYRLLAAALAGRREFGTYAHPDLRVCVRRPELLEDLFLLAEGVRVHHRLAASYPGLAGEMRVLGSRLLERWGREPAPSRTVVLDALLLLALGARPRPAWLAADAARLVARLVAPLAAPGATVQDSLAAARVLAAALDAPALALPAAEPEAVLLPDALTGGEPPGPPRRRKPRPRLLLRRVGPPDRRLPQPLVPAHGGRPRGRRGRVLRPDARRLRAPAARGAPPVPAHPPRDVPHQPRPRGRRGLRPELDHRRAHRRARPPRALHPALPLARARGARRGDPLPPRHERVHRRAARAGGSGQPPGQADHRCPERSARHHDRGA